MNYYTCENGYIGDYRGYEVHSIEPEDFTKEKGLSNPNIIFAVKNDGFSFSLVLDGYLIGDMNASGSIVLYRKKAKWIFKEKPKAKKEVKVKVKVNENTEVKDYSEYSKTVDDFFAGLNKWWKDLEKDA